MCVCVDNILIKLYLTPIKLISMLADLCGSEFVLPAVDAVLEGFLVGREGHALRHDDVVVEEL